MPGIQFSPGCRCCGGDGRCAVVTVTVTGCGHPQVGAAVALKQAGITIGTCITNSLGVCSIPFTTSGAYTVTVSAPGFAFWSQDVTLTCPTDFNILANLTIATGFVCGGGMGMLNCLPCTDGVPLSRTLYFTTALGTQTMIVNDGDTGATFLITGTRSDCLRDHHVVCGARTPSESFLYTDTITIRYLVNCEGDGRWSVQRAWLGIAGYSGCTPPNFPCLYGYQGDTYPTGSIGNHGGSPGDILIYLSGTCVAGHLLMTGTFSDSWTDPFSGPCGSLNPPDFGPVILSS